MNAKPVKKVWTRVALFLVGAGLMGAALYVCFVPRVYFNDGPGFSWNEFNAPEATEIYELRTGLGPADYYEFFLSEEAFLRFASRNKWELSSFDKRDMDRATRVYRPIQFQTEVRPQEYAFVLRGYFWSEYDPQNTDSGFEAMYDSDDERVYFSVHSR